MSLYDILAEHYNEIFPLTDNLIGFITSFSLPGNAKILDTGCAAGELAFALAKMNFSLTGIDLNERMISLAKKRAKKENTGIHFYTMDMIEIDILDTGPFNSILCLGNTLPHLSSLADIRILFSKVFSALASPGLFIVQVLNYDKIMRDKKIFFPVKETKDLILKRNYTFRDDGKIEFLISLQNRVTDEELTDSTLLLPLYNEQLIGDFKQAGFSKIDIFSDFNRTPAGPDRPASIYAAGKE